MQDFDDIDFKNEAVKSPISLENNKYVFQKQKLLFNVTRSDSVRNALYDWLISFEGGISKEAFMQQVRKLDLDDSAAIEQIEKSMGRRAIQKKRAFQQPLQPMEDVIKLLAQGDLFIAVNGQERAIRAFVKSTYKLLKELGRTYVLDLNELKLEWTDKYAQGRSKEIQQFAKDAEFLIIVGLEAPFDMPSYMGDWLNTLRRYRVEKKLPMIVPFARYKEKEIFFEYFRKFHV